MKIWFVQMMRTLVINRDYFQKWIEPKIVNRKFVARFVKKDGTERLINCRLGVHKYLSGGKSVNNPDKHLTVYDMHKKGYRNITFNTLIEIKCGKLHFVKGIMLTEEAV